MDPAGTRRALRSEVLQVALADRAVPWRDVRVLTSTASTNADAAREALAGARSGFTVIADEQTAGRGRLQRAWSSPAGGSLSMSVVLVPELAEPAWGWLPLLVGVAVAETLFALSVPAALKWPNDVVVDGPARDGGSGPRKLGGILLERVGSKVPAAVAGIGLNVDLAAGELPVPTATSLALEAPVVPTREVLAAAMLGSLHRWYTSWLRADGDAGRCGLSATYTRLCCTLGRTVRVELPSGPSREGLATGVDRGGRLLVESDGRTSAYSSGDVRHVRSDIRPGP